MIVRNGPCRPLRPRDVLTAGAGQVTAEVEYEGGVTRVILRDAKTTRLLRTHEFKLDTPDRFDTAVTLAGAMAHWEDRDLAVVTKYK